MKTIFFNKTLLALLAMLSFALAEIQAQTFNYVGDIKPGNRLRVQGVMNSGSGTTYNDFAMMKFSNNGMIDFYTRKVDVSDSNTFDNATLESTYKRMTIDRDGNVGIGIPNPGGKLSIKTTANDQRGLEVFTPDGNTHLPWTNGWSYIGGKGIIFRTTGTHVERMRITTDGNVGIGTNTPGTFKLAVNGTIRAKEIVVEEGWSDYVFYDDYQLPTLEEEEIHIEENGHLLGFESERKHGWRNPTWRCL